MVFAKLIFCGKDFPFPKYQKKKFGGKKINLAKKGGPFSTKTQQFELQFFVSHGLFLEGVYKIESDTKTEYEGF
jgi:hypothetical protein